MPRSLSAQGPTPKPSPNMAVVPDTGYLIPPHVMGRNVDDPTDDLVASGRRLQRPRLGVRVPYRNLTSQIVTQDEIAQEILQRSLRRNPAPPPPPEVKDVFFAMKLTQRLAHRLTTSPVKQEQDQDNRTNNDATQTQPQHGEQKITPPKMDPARERELALKQLQELPSLKKARRRRNEPGPADQLIAAATKLAQATKQAEKLARLKNQPPGQQQQPFKRKLSARKPKSEMDRGIQAGPGTLPDLKPFVKQRRINPSPTKILTTYPAAKKAKVGDVVKKTQVQLLLNGSSPAKPEHEEAESEVSGEVGNKRRRSKLRELDMLLGDEGAVNMIYEAEHGQAGGQKAKSPPTKRASRKSRQDLVLKARLVKNAVLRLSSGPLPSRSRARRKSSPPPTSPPPSSEPNSPPQFSYPPKTPLRAEHSQIIRRRSSDSDSSGRSRSTSPQPLGPLTIIPGPRQKKKGVPIFVKKAVERTYKGKKKLMQQEDAHKQTPKIQLRIAKPDAKKNKISAAVKSKLTDEMSRNFQQALSAPSSPPTQSVVTVPAQSASLPASPRRRKQEPESNETSRNFQQALSAPSSPPTQSMVVVPAQSASLPASPRRRKQELESRPYDEARIILDDDPTLRSLEAQLAAVVGEPLEDQHPIMNSSDMVVEQPADVLREQLIDLFAPSTSSGGVMKSSPPSSSSLPSSPKAAARQSVRQSTAATFCYREINLRRYSNLVQIILTPVSTKMKNALNVQVLRELREALTQLKRDEGCRVVLLSSTGSSFCQGIDVHSLIHANPEKRKRAATDLAAALKEFLKVLSGFSKPIAAAVHGPAVGLGVTMLPYFDMVFASDKATFYAPYAQLGQVPEGAVALTMPSLLGAATASELLYCCRKLTATEAQRSGLVTRILWPDRFQEELIPTLCTIASQSAQAMDSAKVLMRESLRSRLDAALEIESQLLVQHWTSTECQNSFRALLEAEGVCIQKQLAV